MAITIVINNINESVEIQDIIYAVTVTSSSANAVPDAFIQGSFSNILEIGPVISFPSGFIPGNPPTPWTGITIDNTATGNVPTVGAFLMFSKDKSANTSGILGYFMDIDFVNDSKKYIELFQVGAIAEASSQ